MQWFYNLKLDKKLLSGFILISVIAGIISWVGYSNLNKIGNNGDTLYADRVIPIRAPGICKYKLAGNKDVYIKLPAYNCKSRSG